MARRLSASPLLRLSGLEPPVLLRVDPVVLHLLQAPALPDLPGQGGELIVPRLQGQPPLHCGQGPGRVTKVAAQLAQL